MFAPFKSSPIDFNQHLLFPVDIFDPLADDHECYFYTDILLQLDASAVDSTYKARMPNPSLKMRG